MRTAVSWPWPWPWLGESDIQYENLKLQTVELMQVFLLLLFFFLCFSTFSRFRKGLAKFRIFSRSEKSSLKFRLFSRSGKYFFLLHLQTFQLQDSENHMHPCWSVFEHIIHSLGVVKISCHEAISVRDQTNPVHTITYREHKSHILFFRGQGQMFVGQPALCRQVTCTTSEILLWNHI